MTSASPGGASRSGDGRVVVLASGGGSNFQALLDRFAGGAGSARIVGLIASRETAGAVARAERAEVPWVAPPDAASPEDESSFLLETIDRWRGDFVVLAGYMRLVPAGVVDRMRGRIVNIHPALLPSFGGKGMYGMRVHRAVIESGARLTGPTVHFVDEAYDRGPIIAQWPVPVLADDDPEAVAARVLDVEHALLPAVVEALASGAVWLDAEGRVRWKDEWFAADRFRMGADDRFGLLDAIHREA